MNAYDAAEQAYKRGYEQGKKDARKKGRWDKPVEHGLPFKANHLGVVCSYCCSWSDNDYNFCPHCGADMKGEKDA